MEWVCQEFKDTWFSQRVAELVSLFEYLNLFSNFFIPEIVIFNMQFPHHALEACKFCVKSPRSYLFLYSVNGKIYPFRLVVTHLILFTSAIISRCMPIQKARDTINTAVLPVGICCSFWFPYPLTGLLLWDLVCVQPLWFWLNWVKFLKGLERKISLCMKLNTQV
jgi:hypothetical protein